MNSDCDHSPELSFVLSILTSNLTSLTSPRAPPEEDQTLLITPRLFSSCVDYVQNLCTDMNVVIAHPICGANDVNSTVHNHYSANNRKRSLSA